MTVRELMMALAGFDPALPVIMPGEATDYSVVGGPFEDLAVLRGSLAQLADERDSAAQRVVRLFEPD